MIFNSVYQEFYPFDDMISSLNNPKIKHLIQLQSKARFRKDSRQFIVEGIKMFMELPSKLHVQTYISESFYRNCSKEVIEKIAEKPYECMSDKLFREVSDTQSPQGIMAVVHMSEYAIEELMIIDRPIFMILESLQDPGNLGTIIRTAEGAGVTGVILNRTSVDIYNPKVIRSTMGSIYRVPFIYTDCLVETVKKLKSLHVKLYAAHLEGKRYYFEENYTLACGFMIGNEANGLSHSLTLLADDMIKLPMSGQVDSLNAATAASILMYEVKRQRIE